MPSHVSRDGALVISNYVLHAEIPGRSANFQQTTTPIPLRDEMPPDYCAYLIEHP